MRRSHSFLLLGLVLGACTSMGPHPYGPASFSYLDLSPDGTKLAAVSQDGTSKVWNLVTRRAARYAAGVTKSVPFGGYVAEFLTFRGATGEVVGDCGSGRICAWDLASGSERLLLEHDPQDQATAGLSSRDGNRMAFGTRRGAIFTFNVKTEEMKIRKPVDRWSVASPPVIYSLEGTPDLSTVVSATSEITAAVLHLRDPTTIVHENEGWIEVYAQYLVDQENVWREPLWRGICVWSWDGGEPELIDDGFSDKIRADFSSDGTLLAIHQQGGPGAIYDVGTLEQAVPELTNFADGLRFVDVEAKYLAVMSYGEKRLRILTLRGGTPESVDLPLRHWSAGGRRPMVAFPEKQWIFIGLRDGGVDWYQFRAEPKPSLEHVATLR